MFGKCLKEAFYAYQDCNCFDKNAVKTVIFTSYYNLKWLFPILVHFKMLFISVIKAESSASLLLSSVSHDPSENHSNMPICCSRNINYYKYWNLCCLLFLRKPFLCIFFSRIIWWIEGSKEDRRCKTENLWNIINVFTVTFDQFNTSLLNTIICLFCSAEGSVCLTSTQQQKHKPDEAHMVIRFPLRTKLCSAPHKWKLTPSQRAHLLRDTTRKPEYQQKMPLFWSESDPSRSAKCCWENLIYRRGDRKYEQSSALAWFNEPWKWALCVCFRSRLRVQHLFWFQKAFNLAEWAQSVLDVPGSQNKL